MSVFVDTSALYALIDRDDANHGPAAAWLQRISPEEQLVTHNYVVVETSALVQRRFGASILRHLHDVVATGFTVVWVDATLHDAAVVALLAGRTRKVSLVDRVSFELMRRSRIAEAFAFDRDFVGEGFRLVP